MNETSMYDSYYKLCGKDSAVNFVIYTSAVDTGKLRSRLADYNITVVDFFSVFDGVYIVPSLVNSTHPMLDDNMIIKAMTKAGLPHYHHTPSLWLRRFIARMHSPTRYVMFVDIDLVPCTPDYDVMSVFTITTNTIVPNYKLLYYY